MDMPSPQRFGHFKWTPRGSKSSFRIDIDKKDPILLANTFSHQILGPLYSYMTLLGLNHTNISTKKSVWKWPLTIYNYTILVLLIGGAIRRISLIYEKFNDGQKDGSFNILNPIFVVTLCQALLMTSSCAAAFLHLKLQKPIVRNQMFKVIDLGLGRYRQEKYNKIHARINRICIPTSFSFSFAVSTIQTAVKMKYLNLPETPNLINNSLPAVIFEGYLSFIASGCISTLALLFLHLCLMLHFSITQLIEEMVPNNKEECTPPQQSLQQIHKVRVHYQDISNAKNFIEQNFSFSLFYTYGSCIPLICFLGFIAMRNMSQKKMAETMSLMVFCCSIFSTLMFFSIPAFMIAEEGDKLLTASFRMYHDTLYENPDSQVVSQMSFLAFQMHATKLTLSAANFFQMNRKILISLFSAIFTYFLILIQFDAGISHIGDCQVRPLIFQPPS